METHQAEEPRSSGEKSQKNKKKNVRHSAARYCVLVTIWTFCVSMALSFLSDQALVGSTYLIASILLLVIVFVGIITDIIGVASTAADEKPFHSMSARKVRGAKEAVALIRNADKVSSICCDVIGDICGIISGSTGVVIVTRLVTDFNMNELIVSLLITAATAALMVGGKAIGKNLAMTYSTAIVLAIAKVLALFGDAGRWIRKLFSGKKKK